MLGHGLVVGQQITSYVTQGLDVTDYPTANILKIALPVPKIDRKSQQRVEGTGGIKWPRGTFKQVFHFL